MTLQGGNGIGRHPAGEGAAAFIHDLPGAQRVLERLNLLERPRVPLVEEAAWNLRVQTQQGGGIHAESAQSFALGRVNSHESGEPVDALENDAGGARAQECRGRLGGPDTAPDEDVQRLRAGAQHFLDRRV